MRGSYGGNKNKTKKKNSVRQKCVTLDLRNHVDHGEAMPSSKHSTNRFPYRQALRSAASFPRSSIPLPQPCLRPDPEITSTCARSCTISKCTDSIYTTPSILFLTASYRLCQNIFANGVHLV